MTTELIALAVLAATALAEWLQARRVRRVTALAFGPAGRPREWTWLAPFLRPVGLALLAWGFLTLFAMDPKVARPKKIPEGGWRHLIIGLDVSPSMQLKDAGPVAGQTRAKRAAEILMSVLDRIVLQQCRVSVVAFYNGARPVVVDCTDPEVIRNILNDLPLDQAFAVGKTRILDGIKEACDLAKAWKPSSTTLILVSDGDSVPDAGMPPLPQAIGQVLVVGVGDARLGKFIDGHQSRQDASTLRQVAARLRGVYHDGNEKHLPSQNLSALAAVLPMKEETKTGRRELALLAVTIGAILLSGLPLALGLAGSTWRAGRAPDRADQLRQEGRGLQAASSRSD